MPTRDRLLDAAVTACVERGFEGVALSDIARRAGVSTPAIYHHFSGKAELLVEACRTALSRLVTSATGGAVDPIVVGRTYLDDSFADARRLQLELHLAAGRHGDVADLLAKWHADNAAVWAALVPGDEDPATTVTAFYLLLLGIAQIDALSGLGADRAELGRRVDALVSSVFVTAG